MSHKTGSRRTSDLECPLASLGRNSNAVRDHYHHPHPLSSSPLDPQAYKMMSRKSPNPGMDAQSPNEQATASSTAAAVLHMVQQKAATFELRSRHSRPEQAIYGAHSTASVGRHAKKSPELPAPATRNVAPVPQPRNFLTLEHVLQFGTQRPSWMHGNSADTEDSSDNNAGGGTGSGSGGGGEEDLEEDAPKADAAVCPLCWAATAAAAVAPSICWTRRWSRCIWATPCEPCPWAPRRVSTKTSATTWRTTAAAAGTSDCQVGNSVFYFF